MQVVITTEKYVRKPLYVDAVQVSEENFASLALWCQGDIMNTDGSPLQRNGGNPIVDPMAQYIRVRVHTPKHPRQTQAFVGDWILYTDRGYKVYSNKAFKESFSLVA